MKSRPKTGTEVQKIYKEIFTRWDGIMYRIRKIEGDIRMLEEKFEYLQTTIMIQSPK